LCVLLSGRLCAVAGPNATQGLPTHDEFTCFNEAGLPLSALPFTELKKNDKVVYRIPYTNEDGALVEEFWYGVVTLICKHNHTWIKFLDLENDSKISEEKHLTDQSEYFDRWMKVARTQGE
jgi:hypothetical protein